MSALSFRNQAVYSKFPNNRIFNAETPNQVFGKGIGFGDF